LTNRKAADKAARYLLGRRHYMRYGDALGRGLPIATGVIEGACRHLMRERLDRCGARWSVVGGEAILKLRALRLSGDFDEYRGFHLAREHERKPWLNLRGRYGPRADPEAALAA